MAGYQAGEAFKFPDETEDGFEIDDIEVADNKGEVDVANEDDFDVEVVDDTPPQDRGRKPLDKEVEDPSDEELDNYTAGVQKRIKELTHARHDERRKAEALAREKAELERVAQMMLDENKRLKEMYSKSEEYFSVAAKSATAAELEAARREYKEAYESGDSDKLLAAQEKLTDAKFKHQQAQQFKPTALPETNFAVQQQQPAPQQAPQLDQKTLNWQAKNQWFGQAGYEEMTSFALGLHQKLVNNGVDPSSDAYFEQIDARLRKTFPEVFQDQGIQDEARPSKKPASTVVAPSGRSTGTRKVTLTATQVALAKRLGITPQEYAAELVRMERKNA